MNRRDDLFLSTGNSCRSQMVEAIVNARAWGAWQATSAGTQPSGYVHPKVIAALAEIGIQHLCVSKYTEQIQDEDFDLVVTVCDDTAENYPVWLGHEKRVHMGFPDPVKTDVMDDF